MPQCGWTDLASILASRLASDSGLRLSQTQPQGLASVSVLVLLESLDTANCRMGVR